MKRKIFMESILDFVSIPFKPVKINENSKIKLKILI